MIEPSKELNKLAYVVLQAAIEVHRELGPGYLESIYEEALSIELKLRDISFERQKEIAIHYKERALGKNRLDFLIDNQLIIELKAVETLAPIHKAQVISYLKATNCCLGLLVNFNVPILLKGVERIILSQNLKNP